LILVFEDPSMVSNVQICPSFLSSIIIFWNIAWSRTFSSVEKYSEIKSDFSLQVF